MLDKEQIWVFLLFKFKMSHKAEETTCHINNAFGPEVLTNIQHSGGWRGCGEKGTLLHCWRECKLVQLLWRTVWRFLKKLEIELPYDPAIPLLGIHTEETRIERDAYIPMFITALSIIARTWKQPRCPSADEWIKKAVAHIHNGVLLSH